MKAVMRSIIAGVACAWLLAGCGGGASSGENSSDNDAGQSPRTVLQVSVTDIPDEALRACVNRLAREHEWQTVEAVDSIVCGDVEIRSIQGLQAFSGLRTLKIAAPRLPVSEIPLLASLPLEDYQRKPFYLLNDESSAQNAEPGMKQLLMDGRVTVVNDQAITYVMLLTNDPRNPDQLSWRIEEEHDYLPGSSGILRVGTYVTLHWVRLNSDDAGYFAVEPSYGGDVKPEGEKPFVRPRQVHPDQPLAAVSFGDDAFAACVAENASQQGWVSTWQVTVLDCSRRGIHYLSGLDYLPQLERLDLRGNSLRFSSSLLQSQTDADVIVHDTAVSPPVVEIRECGVFIANYDPAAHYRVWQIQSTSIFLLGITYESLEYLRDWMMYGPVPEDWQPGQTEQCMPIAGRGAGAWVVDVEKDGIRVGAELFPVSDENGNWVQYLTDARLVEPLMFLPGFGSSSLYVFKAAEDEYELRQLNSASWQTGTTHKVDRLPYLATQEGVFLFPARSHDGWQRTDVALLRDSGTIDELPPRPLAGRPTDVLEAGNEIWLTGLTDEWGARPEILVWNPGARQWRVAPDIGTSRYSPYLNGDVLCVSPRALADRGLCWSAEGQQWVSAGDNTLPSRTHVAGNYRYRLDDELGVYMLIRMMFGSGLPSTIADAVDESLYRSQIASDIQDLVVEEIESLVLIIGKHLSIEGVVSADLLRFSLPLRMDVRALDGEVLIKFNDNVGRYALPAGGSENPE